MSSNFVDALLVKHFAGCFFLRIIKFALTTATSATFASYAKMIAANSPWP